MTTYTINNSLNGIEIYFDAKPSASILATLKADKWRWHNVKKCWYNKNTENNLKTATEITEGATTNTAEPKQETKLNKYGVKVGDIFSASWGYDQTNVDFFQVVELVGKESVRVREVYLPVLDERPTCGMAADYTYKVVRDLLPAAPRGVFIKDQERGDLKRIRPGYDKDPETAMKNCKFTLSSFASAYKVNADTTTEYVSWYA